MDISFKSLSFCVCVIIQKILNLLPRAFILTSVNVSLSSFKC